MKKIKRSLTTCLALLLVMSTMVSALSVSAAPGPKFSTLGWNIEKGSWEEGNLGTWPEGSSVGIEILIENTSKKPLALTELDLIFSFFDSSTDSVGVDYINNYYYSTTTQFSAGDIAQFPSTDTGWIPFTPSIQNLPWTGNIGDISGTESASSPVEDHFWGINPETDLANLSSGILPAGEKLAIYFELHLALSFVWNNGEEGQLPINGIVNDAVVIDRSAWSVTHNGAGYFPGSKLHGGLASEVTGVKTISLPAISQIDGVISGNKIFDSDENGVRDPDETGISDWPIILTTQIDGGQLTIIQYTDSNGAYIFSGLPYRDYTISEPLVYNGLVPTDDISSHNVTLSADAPTASGIDFFNHPAPPIADFEFYGFEDDEIYPLESSIVQLVDKSYSQYSGGTIESWEWNVVVVKDGDIDSSVSSNLQHPLFIPPDEGIYEVTLTVTDTNGKSASLVRSLEVLNAPPKAKALSLEVFAGEDAELTGRLLDPGWSDWHVLASSDPNWDPDSLEEDHVPYMGTGIVTGTVNTSQNLDGYLSIQDNYGDSSKVAEYEVTVIPKDPEDREVPGNDTMTDDLPKVKADSIIRSFIQEPGDVDIYEITTGSGEDLAAGSEVLIQLKGLPADYDVAVLGEAPDAETAGFMSGGFMSGGFMSGGFMSGGFMSGGFMSGGFMSGGFMSGGFMSGGFMSGGFMSGDYSRAGFMSGGFMSGGFMSGGFMSGGFMSGPYTDAPFNQYPLSQLGYTGIDPNSIGGVDLSLDEIGLGGIGGENMQVLNFSANQGLDNESILLKVDYTGEKLFVVVKGSNGVFNTAEAYVLQVEVSDPVYTSQWLSGFPYDSPDVDNYNNTALETIGGDGTLTLFVTQQDRMEARYGTESWESLKGNLITLAGQDSIDGKIISIPISYYEDWDAEAWSVDAANAVALNIRDIIQQEISTYGYEYVVIIGDDDIVPFHRLPDKTVIGNERDYAPDSFFKPGSPLFSSIVGGNILNDDYYVSTESTTEAGQPLFIPLVAISRLVETPEDINITINAYTGQIDLNNASATGYDFFYDGTQAEISLMTDALGIDSIDSLLSDTWTAEELMLMFEDAYSISAPNAHYNHYVALSAAGFWDTADTLNESFLTSTTLNGITAGALQNSVVYTLGCRAGLSVPDETALSAEEIGFGIDPQLDFPQVMTSQAAVYIASTGTGLGESDGVAGTEELIGIFTDYLLNEGTTVGKALLKAKQDYLSGLSVTTEYEVKSSVEFTMFGLPQSLTGQFDTANQLSSNLLPTSQSLASITTDLPTVSLDLNIDDDQSTYTLEPVPSDNGTYYAAIVDGTASTQNTPLRPVQPRIKISPPIQGAGLVHGVLLTSGEFEDLAGFDPVISKPTYEWDSPNSVEPQTSPSGFWPAELATVNTLELGDDQFLQTLLILPGQFQPTAGTDPLTGTERLFSNLSFDLIRSESDDWRPPTVKSYGIQKINDDIEVAIDATDANGIERIVVLLIRNNEYSVIFDRSQSPTNGEFTFSLQEYETGYQYDANDRFIIELLDPAGNNTVATGKGSTIKLVDVDLHDGVVFTPNQDTEFTAEIINFDDETPYSYIWDFGDGIFESGQVTGNIIETGHTFDWGAPVREVNLKVVSIDGGVGIDSTVAEILKTPTSTDLSVMPEPYDGVVSIIIGQEVSFTATVVGDSDDDSKPVPSGTVQLLIDGEAFGPTVALTNGSATISTTSLTPGAHTVQAVYSGDSYYQSSTGTLNADIVVQYGWGGFISPIDNSQYNQGRNIPVKFALTDYNGNSIQALTPPVIVIKNENGEIYRTPGIDYDPVSERYQYNIDTDDIPLGPITLWVLLDDGLLYGGIQLTIK